jgi:membrane protein insertase Oxa1/YidC/SpoIIIJ
MRVLKPEIDELNAKFEKVDDPMKKQQETMALYREQELIHYLVVCQCYCSFLF